MKLFIILCLAFSGLVNNNDNPISLKEGTPMEYVMSQYPDYHFKFHKVLHDSPSYEMGFGLLGYWKDNKGYVLQFGYKGLVYTYEFNNLNEYKEFITNPEEKENIVIYETNLN